MWTLAGLAFFGAIAADDGMDQDVRLAKAVTVEVQMLPLPDALQQLSKASGVTLESTGRFRDLKVTVLAEKDSALRVMKAIASTLDLTWVPAGKGYRLEESERVADELRLYRMAEEKEARTTIQSLLTNWQVPPGGASERALDADAWGAVLKNLSAAQWTAFWKGKPLYLPQTDTGTPVAGTRPAPVLRSKLQFDPLRLQLITNTRAANPVSPYYAPKGSLAELPFGKRTLSWASRADGEALKVPVQIRFEDRRWFSDQKSAADYLAEIHRKSHLTIVADAFRTPISAGVTAASVAEWLTAFANQSHGFVRTESDVIMFRHPAYWRLRNSEIPERLLKPLESASVPTPSDYVSFVSSLSELQQLNFALPNTYLLKVDALPLVTALPGLRFMTMLTPEQRARASRGIDAASLGVAAQSLFLDILEDAPEAKTDISRQSAIFAWSTQKSGAKLTFSRAGRAMEYRIAAREPDFVPQGGQ